MAESLPVNQLPDIADEITDIRRAVDSLESKVIPWLTAVVLIASDVVSLILAGLFSVLLRFSVSTWMDVPELYLNLWPILSLFVLAYAANGLYSGVALNPANELRRITLSTSLVYLASGSVIFLFSVSDQYSRGLFLIAWILSLFLLPLVRGLIRHRFSRCSWWGHPVVIMGASQAGEMVLQVLTAHPEFGLKPVVILDDDPQYQGDLQSIPVIGGLRLGPAVAQRLPGAYGIIALHQLPRQQLLDIVERYAQSFHHLLVIPDLIGFSSLWAEAKDVGGILGLEVRQQLLNRRSMVVKRVLDLGGSIVGLLLISPLLLVIAIMVKIDSPGPLFFGQERFGLNGKRFIAYKFRSMYVDAEERLHQILATDPVARQEYTLFHKLRNDPRVTRVGRMLRKYSLDELPQLWNVLRGEMSLVGPRAYMPRELSEMNGKERVILQVLPGITGLWQVSGRNRLSFPARLDLDMYYVRNWSPWFDLHILARTVWVVLTGDGAH